MSSATSMPREKIICVLGMHRSGTSLLTRVLNLLGMDLGREERLMKPDRFNPKGYWEHQAIVDLDEEILARLGGTWFDPPEFPAGWELSAEFSDLRQRARKLIDDDFGAATCWGWKDPRTCLTLPFWKQVLPPLFYVICLRNPTDVAKSLEHAMPIEKGMNLWHQYTTAALEHSAGQPRMFIFYEDLMENWPEHSQRLAQIVSAPGTPAAAALDEIRGTVTNELRHHRASLLDVVDESRLAFPAKALYVSLRLAVRFEQTTGDLQKDRQLQDVLNAFNRYSGLAHEERVRLEKDLAASRQRTAELEGPAGELAQRDAALREARLEVDRRAARTSELSSQLELMQREAQKLQEELAARDAKIRGLQAVIEQSPADVQDMVRDQSGQGGWPSAGGGAASRVLDRRSYREMVERVRRMVAASVPPNATVAVINKGDPQLLRLEGRQGWHFPQLEDGSYAGYYPGDSAQATAALERIRAKRADFLLIPVTSFWWLDHYKNFAKHLRAHYPVIAREEETGVLFALQGRPDRQPAPLPDAKDYGRLVRQVRDVVAGILPRDATVLVLSQGDPALLELGTRTAFDFPPSANGGVATGNAADGATAIEQLEDFRCQGAQFLVFPKTALRWLDRNRKFARHLENRYRAVVRQRHVCTIFDLSER